MPLSNTEVAHSRECRLRAMHDLERAEKELLPNVRRTLEASAERWEILARSHEPPVRCRPQFLLVKTGAHVPPSSVSVLRIGEEDFVMDPLQTVLRGKGGPVPLTKSEYAVLDLLRIYQGTAVSKPELLAQLYSSDVRRGARILDVFIWKLRAKLSGVCNGPSCIETVRGFGYRLTGPSPQLAAA